MTGVESQSWYRFDTYRKSKEWGLGDGLVVVKSLVATARDQVQLSVPTWPHTTVSNSNPRVPSALF